MKFSSKKELRQECYNILDSLSEESLEIKSKLICDRISSLNLFKQSKTIFSYYPFSKEPNILPLFENFKEKTWAFPALVNEEILFFKTNSKSDFKKNPLNFLEPKIKNKFLINYTDIILIPGLGFDKNNKTRLGRGKGHYDKFLSKFKSIKNNNPYLIGVCFFDQIMNLISEPHDIPVDLIISEY